ncbi:hypothetical protein [Chryseobacterium taichungense]|uniref:hypothetical protein n=1 Tax=Chryseobacterium taichungense TaxID=295069 RepID=UPI0028A86A68|nr:hypothetical protein [Chryseobacterium taichungense]
MKKFVLLFFGILLFDIVYIFVYDQFLIGIQPEFLQYPFVFIKYFVSAPAILCADSNVSVVTDIYRKCFATNTFDLYYFLQKEKKGLERI